MALTSSQEKFLNTNDKNILLSASAGSGKTFILIQKICDGIISKNEDITDYLVLTFTNAAANELKKRLEVSLKQNLNEHCLEQLEKLPSASISTFDSFCSNLLKKYFFKININPNFNIVLDDEAEILKTRSFNYSLENLYKNSTEDYFFIFKNFKLDSSTNSLYMVICKFYNYFYGEQLDINEIIIDKEKYYNFFNEYICDKYKQLVSLLNELTIKLKQNEMLKEVAVINEISSFAHSIQESNGLFKNLELINNLKLSTLPKINKDYNFIQEELYNKLKFLKSTYLSKLNANIKKIGFNEEDFDNCYNLNLKILKIICNIYNNFIIEYDKLKEEKTNYNIDIGLIEMGMEKEIKTSKEYKIKKIEELKETLPNYGEELMFKFFGYTTVLTLNGVVNTNLQPLYSMLPITVIACFINTIISKYHNLMEMDRLRTDLKLDEAMESEFINILEDNKQQLSEMNKEKNNRFVINCIIGIVSIISACISKKFNIPELTNLLSLTGTYGLLGFVEKSCEMKQIDMRMKQIEEKQELFELQRTRKQ